MPEDAPEHVVKLFWLTVDLLRTDGLPPRTYGALWMGLTMLFYGRPAVARLALESNLMELAVSHLQASGTASEWMVRACYLTERAFRCRRLSPGPIPKFALQLCHVFFAEHLAR